MLSSLILATASIGITIWMLQRHGCSFGLPVSYLICLSLIHLPGGLVHWLQPGVLPNDRETEIGLEITSICMICFCIGTGLFQWKNGLQLRSLTQDLQALGSDSKFWRFCATAGLLSSFVVTPLRAIPSLGAVLRSAELLWVAGVILAIRYLTSSKRTSANVWGWAGISLINPFLSLFGQGFLGYGITSITQVYSVVLVQKRKLLLAFLIVSLGFYLGLGIGVTYLVGRNSIRASVWGGGSTEERVDAIRSTFETISLFDPYDKDQATLLDLRLNQNALVGAAQLNIAAGSGQFLQGKTIADAFIALIPRIIWPDKPEVGGSGELVSNATGIGFATGTSVGIGNVMEAYLNFGSTGCAVIFLLFGYGLSWLDFRAYKSELVRDYKVYLASFLPALAIVQPGGSFAEMASSVAAAWIAARIWFSVWDQRQRRSQRYLKSELEPRT